MNLHELVKLVKKMSLEMGSVPKYRDLAEFVSKRTIDKHGFNEILDAAGLDRTKSNEPEEIIIKPPRILVLDIETSAMLVYAYGLYDQTIGTNMIHKDWHLYSFAGRFLGEEKIHYMDQRKEKDISNDEKLTRFIHKLMKESDVIIGHNVRRFDLKKINTRFLKYDLDPLNHYQVIDTLSIAKKYFSVTSNKLSFLAEFLGCKDGKSEHLKYPGFQLWMELEKGNKDAWIECESYNKQDIVVTEFAYQRLVKYDPTINFSVFEQKAVCTCGSFNFYKDGMRYLRSAVKQIYRCNQCGKSFTGKENLIHKDVRKSLP